MVIFSVYTIEVWEKISEIFGGSIRIGYQFSKGFSLGRPKVVTNHVAQSHIHIRFFFYGVGFAYNIFHQSNKHLDLVFV